MKLLLIASLLLPTMLWAQTLALDPKVLGIEAFDTVPHAEGIVPKNLLPMPPECIKAMQLDEKQSATLREALDRTKYIRPREEARKQALVELKRMLRPEQVAACRDWYKSVNKTCPLDAEENMAPKPIQ